MDRLSQICIYTVRDSRALREQFETGLTSPLKEHRAWTTGSRYWADARRSGERMPLLFGNADDAFASANPGTMLLYWATIEDITINPHDERPSTICAYTDLREIDPPKPLSSLRLVSKGRPMKEGDIRPYRICYTPGFLAI